MVLHGSKPGPPVPFGRVLRFGELPGEHAAGAEVARLARPDDVVQGLHGLLGRRAGVPAVDLVEVDVVGAQTPQRGVDGGQDVLTGQAAVVLPRTGREVDLGGEHVVVPAREHLRQQAAGDDLACSAVVGVGGVEERHAAVDGGADDGLGDVLALRPGPFCVVAVAHHAQADAGDPEAGRADVHVLHCHRSPALRLGRSAHRGCPGRLPGPVPGGFPGLARSAGWCPRRSWCCQAWLSASRVLAGDQVRDLTAMIVWWSSSAVFLKAHGFIRRYEGRIGSLKHPADLLWTIGVALTGVASVLTAISLSDQPDGARRLTWRARFVAANRRHPRLRGVAVGCLAVSLIAFIGFAVTALS